MVENQLATEQEIQSAYRDRDGAAQYVARRFTNQLHGLLHDRQVAAVNSAIARLRPSRVLEIAPGPGRLTRDIDASFPIVCLEYNDAMIEQGRPAVRDRASWVRGNGFQLPFGQDFDLLYSFRFVRHFHGEDRQRIYAEVRRVLRPGGAFIMDAVNERISRPLRTACPQDYPIYDKLYHEDELRAELRDAGFEPVELVPVQRRVRWQGLSQVILGPRADRINRLVIRGLERLPARDGLEWIVTCRRA